MRQLFFAAFFLNLLAVATTEAVDNTVFDKWRTVVGERFIIRDDTSQYESATFKTNRKVLGVIKPRTREQVQECVKIASEYNISLYAVSGGKNWGYGSSVPTANHCVVMDLGRMNRILEYNETFGYVVIEPGVTFGQLYDFINDSSKQWLAPSSRTGRHGSIIGNTLERGLGQGRYGDRLANCCNLGVVLANGEYIETGIEGFAGEDVKTVKHLYKWGLGPSLDGMFTQSNFGVVTQMTVWLEKMPKDFQVAYYSVNEGEQLGMVVDRLRQLLMEGTIQGHFMIVNDHHLLSTHKQYPWKKMRSRVPLSEVVMEGERSFHGGGDWVGQITISSATRAQGNADKERVRKVLGTAVDKLVFLDTSKAKWIKRFRKPLGWYYGVDVDYLLSQVQKSPYQGEPTDDLHKIAYWRKKMEVPEQIDLEGHKCGIIWCSPVVPLEGRSVEDAVNIMERVYSKYKYEPNLGLTVLSERAAVITGGILFDREVSGEDDNALACYNEMLDRLRKAGYPPYRLGVQSMSDSFGGDQNYHKLLSRLKSAIDKKNILLPGRYGINADNS